MSFPKSVGRDFVVGPARNYAGFSAILLALSLILIAAKSAAESAPTNPPPFELKLSEYLQRVLDNNEAIQAQMLEAEASRRKARGERGIFEPELVNSLTREINRRTNNTEQRAAQGGAGFFSERNTVYDSGLESLIPTGAKIRLGYTMSDLVNNVNPYGSILTTTNNFYTRQYQTFVGATLTQPLLKNGGTGVTLAGIRIAALDSDVAFQEYRRQLMLTISRAEAAYWNLYFAQEQLRFFEESVSVAQSILNDSQEKVKAGRAAELEVLEAQSGLAVRKTKQNEALQSYYTAIGAVCTLSGVSPTHANRSIRAVDVPTAASTPFAYSNSFQDAFELNPDYLIQQKKLEAEKLRLGVARNQVLPELNVKGAYGYNGLGRTPGDSLDIASSQEFPSWSVALELRLPLAGNIKGRNQLAATKLTLQEAVANLNSIQTQIANLLDTSIRKARSWQDSIQSYETVVRFNEDLLKTQLARLEVGRIEPRKVLEVEADLFDARQNLASALVEYHRTLLELQLADGTILKSRNLDLTREQLQQRTLALLNRGAMPEANFKPLPYFQPPANSY
ncbi:MAG TPA: TolC family protein [Candidatus Paceibacterota bacterium]|nr:TolC family protein [Candidatus Paceibacterota bacterium]